MKKRSPIKLKNEEDELSEYLASYEAGPQRPYFKTTPSSNLTQFLSKFSRFETVVFSFLMILTLCVRLYKLDHPDSVVFDEVHLVRFISKYINGAYFVDVHPPLVKLIYYFIAKWNSYGVEIENISVGTNYGDASGNIVIPYVPLRLFSAFCGVTTVFTTYKITKLSGCRPLVCLFGSLICCFENSLITQSRFILLDSPLVFFISLTVFSYKLFETSQPFTKSWFKYLCLLGFSLALVLGTKLVGIFTFAFIGLLTLKDFWFLIGDLNVSGRVIVKHFTSRFYFLIMTPAVLYLGLFAVHFMILPYVGEGTSHMTPQFQSTLQDSVIHDFYSDVLYGSAVSIRHVGTGGYLHSHNATYPKTGQQQVTLYDFQDENNDWTIEEKTKAVDSESFEKVSPLRNFLRIKLFHGTQSRYLRVNDNRPPMSEQDYNNEVTLIGDENYLGDGNNEVFEIRLVSERSRITPGSEFEIKAVDSVFQLYHVGTGCFLLSHNTKLPSWGFNQNEVICIEKPTLENSLWYFEKNTHPILENDPKAKKLDLPVMGFWEKIKEVHKVMLRMNNGLTSEHIYASDPISWPFAIKEVGYWSKGNENVYFLGNFVVYWSIVITLVGFITFMSIKFLSMLKPSHFAKVAKPTEPQTVKYIYNVSQFALGWFVHFAPSFYMGRQLFLHHYLPSLYFGILVITQTSEFLFSKYKILGYLWMIAVLYGALKVFWDLSPIIFALNWTVDACENAMMISSWNINCSAYV